MEFAFSVKNLNLLANINSDIYKFKGSPNNINYANSNIV